VKTQVIIGIALLSVAATTFGIGSPVLNILHPCPPYYMANNCSYEMKLSMSVFAVAFTIGGIGILALYRLRVPGIEKQKTDA
jgi:hypothetical protein